MATPTTAITRFELGSTFHEFDLDMARMKYIGAQVLKPRGVGVVAANIGKVPIGQLLANANATTARNPGAGYARDTFEFDKWAYAVQEYGKEQPLDDSQERMYADIIDAEQISIQKARDAVLNEYERKVAALTMNPTTFAGHTGAGSNWTNFNTSTPVNDVIGALKSASDASGIEANALILGVDAWRNMMQSADLIDRVQFTQTPTNKTLMSLLPEILGIDRIIVGGGFTNTAHEGQPATISRIWPTTMALACRIAVTEDPQEPCIGRTFIWTGDGPGAPGDGGSLAVIAEEYREEKVRGAVYRARCNYDLQIMYAAAGYLLTGLTG